jgi:DNA-binding transcriptional LysR family regulator
MIVPPGKLRVSVRSSRSGLGRSLNSGSPAPSATGRMTRRYSSIRPCLQIKQLEATQQIIAAFGRRRAGWRVDLQQAAWSDPTAGLADGDVDTALLRLPFPGQDDMRIEVLLTEPRWVALPVTHPLAAANQICFRQLWDEPFVAAPAETGLWRDYHLATAERQGHPVRIGAVTDQPDAYLTAIANGDGIALVPESASRYYARPGITYRPVTGVSPSQVGVAWPPANDANPVVQDFVRCCLDNKPPP